MKARDISDIQAKLAKARRAVREVEEYEELRDKPGVDVSADYQAQQNTLQAALIDALYDLDSLIDDTEKVELDNGNVVELPGNAPDRAANRELPERR